MSGGCDYRKLTSRFKKTLKLPGNNNSKMSREGNSNAQDEVKKPVQTCAYAAHLLGFMGAVASIFRTDYFKILQFF